MKPACRRDLAGGLQVTYGVSARRACEVVLLSRANYCQDVLRMRIRDIAQSRAHYGYRRIQVQLRREGWPVNHKRVYRLYTQECLTMKRAKPRRHVSSPKRVERAVAQGPNEVWAMDFMADPLFAQPPSFVQFS